MTDKTARQEITATSVLVAAVSFALPWDFAGPAGPETEILRNQADVVAMARRFRRRAATSAGFGH
jgi:hypothetical protein